MDLLNQSLASLATRYAGVTQVFHHYRLDFCCGGDQSLQQALTKRSLDAAEVMARLQPLVAQPQTQQNWQEQPPMALIHHLLDRFHAQHRLQLPELIRLARRVEQVHADHPQCPTGLAAHLTTMLQELENHMQKEEQILFPLLAQGIYPAGPLQVMAAEHQDHGQALSRMMALAHDLVLPEGACNTWMALYLGVKALREALMEHIHLENNILFQQPAANTHYCCGSCS